MFLHFANLKSSAPVFVLSCVSAAAVLDSRQAWLLDCLLWVGIDGNS